MRGSADTTVPKMGSILMKQMNQQTRTNIYIYTHDYRVRTGITIHDLRNYPCTQHIRLPATPWESFGRLHARSLGLRIGPRMPEDGFRPDAGLLLRDVFETM